MYHLLILPSQTKPVTMKDQAFSSLLNPDSHSRSPSPSALPSHFEEQRALRDETISAFHQAVSGDEDGADNDDDAGGGLLTLREKTKDELVREEEEYKAYLEREVGNVKDLVWVEPVQSTSKTPEADQPSGSEEEGGDGTAGTSDKKKKKKKKKKGQEPKKRETDQEFLMKCVIRMFLALAIPLMPTPACQLHHEPRLDRSGIPPLTYIFRDYWHTTHLTNNKTRCKTKW